MQVQIRCLISFLITMTFFSIVLGQDLTSFENQSGMQNAPDIHFEHLTVTQGLSDNFISAALQDRQGFLWFATRNGLNKYDGSKVIVYRHDPSDPNTLSSNYVWHLFEDHSGILWVGTWGGGLNKFDPTTEKFTRYQHDENNPNSLGSDLIWCVKEDKEGKLWIGTDGGGLNWFDPVTEIFVRYQHEPNDPHSLSSNRVHYVHLASDGMIWAATYGGGLNKFDPTTEIFVHYQHDENNANSLSDNFVMNIYVDRDGLMWLGTQGGLNRFDPTTETFTHYQYDEIDPNSLSYNSVSFTYEDNMGVFWIGTLGGGLNWFDPVTETFVRYQHKPQNLRTISDNTIWCMIEDMMGSLWFSTSNGVDKYDPGNHRFAHYQSRSLNPNSLSANPIQAIYEEDGVLWLGTDGGGLNKFDRANNHFTHYQYEPDNPNSLSHNSVVAIKKDSQDLFWIGTMEGGFNKCDPQQEIFTRYQHDFNVRDIEIDTAGILWIGVDYGGLFKFDPMNETWVRHQHDENNPNSLISDWIMSVSIDATGMVWIGTESGLSQFDPINNHFTNYRQDNNDPSGLSNNIISDVYEDSQGRLWVATGDGLNRFNRTTQTFTVYRDKQGVAGNYILAIVEDDQGFLWISTDKGLSKFDVQNKSFRNYDVRDGLQGNRFLMHSVYKSQSGELFFGGVNGFNAFYPEQLTDNLYIPPVVLTDFQIFNRSISIGEDSPLRQHINLAKQITLSHQQSVFSFEFAALNYRSPQKNQYAYFMEGFDQEWTYTDVRRRFATYTNLAPGEYTFRVKASNNDGVWNEKGTSIKIIITPPWWQTWWAYSCYAMVILGSLISFFVAQQKKLVKTRAINERLQQADKLKDEFLANTSHELRTPLNGIIGLAESLIDGATGELNQQTKTNLAMIASSGKRLASLVNDILDFSKLKHREIILQLKPIELRSIVEMVLALSQPLIAQRKLELVNRVKSDLPALFADENRLQQILYNLIGNAIKFTEQGQIIIFAQVINKQQVQITVLDEGIGIPADKLESIFEFFEQAEGSTSRKYGGTGLGLAVTRKLVELHGGQIWVESTLGSGSQFIFTLPISTERAVPIASNPPQLIPSLATTLCQTAKVDEPPMAQNSATSKILIVDDEPVNLQVLHNYLSLQNYTIVQATSGHEALKFLDDGLIPDVILLDVMMPQMTGYEVTHRLREKWQAIELPILLLTAKNQVEDLVQGLEMGANDYMTKPISKKELLARVKTHLSLKKLAADNLRMRAELKVAKHLQQMVLPKKEELQQIEQLDIAGFMEPANEVGGDYYDVLEHNGNIKIGIGDVTGHGLESGVVMLMVQMAVQTLLTYEVSDPKRFLMVINQAIYKNIQRIQIHKNLTLSLLDYENGRLRITGQHEDILLVRKGGVVERIETFDLGFMIGVVDDISEFTSHREISLQPGDGVVLYTDGITEARNLEKRQYGFERLCEVVSCHWSGTAQEVQLAVIADVKSYVGTQQIFDDITLLVLKQK